MDRPEWLRRKREAIEQRYDRLWAPIYDDNWGSDIYPLHQQMLTRIVSQLSPHASILDAACGTGKYWPLLLSAGMDVVGIDQSIQMLNRAQAKFPIVKIEKISLQEISYRSAFDLIMCMDAMEMVFPEDWLLVLGNFYNALTPVGQLYFTVELAALSAIEQDYKAALDRGLPVVWGESAAATGPGDIQGGYHFYPSMDQVRHWLNEAGFSVVEEAESNDYHHFWVKKA